MIILTSNISFIYSKYLPNTYHVLSSIINNSDIQVNRPLFYYLGTYLLLVYDVIYCHQFILFRFQKAEIIRYHYFMVPQLNKYPLIL